MLDAAPVAIKPKPPAKTRLFVTATFTASSDDKKRAWRTPGFGRTWCESKAGDGVGESITIKFSKPTEVSIVTATAGIWGRAGLDQKFNLPTTLSLTLDSGTPIAAQVDKEDGETRWDIEPAQVVEQVKLSIAAVKRGKKRKSCLSDIEISNTTHTWLHPVEAPDSAIAVLPQALKEISAAFKDCDRKALARVSQFPFRWWVSWEGYEPPTEGAIGKASGLAKACKELDEDNKVGFVDLDLDGLESTQGASWIFYGYSKLELRWTKSGWKAVGAHLDMM
jgi:hypothetical protein